MDCRAKDGPIRNQLGVGVMMPDIANPLTARMHKGINTTMDEGQTMVAHALRAEGFDASEDGTGRGTPLVPEISGAICRDSFAGGPGGRPEGAAAGHFVPVVFDSKGTGVQFDDKGGAPTLRSMGHANSHQNAGGQLAIAIQERAVCENPDAGPDGAGVRDDGAAYTLEARSVSRAVAFDLNQVTSKTNRSQPDPAVHHTLPATTTPPHLATAWAVRRLTPRECERLQGFPDDYTLLDGAAKPQADGPRYKQLGNSMAVNVMRWIGTRMVMVDEALGLTRDGRAA